MNRRNFLTTSLVAGAGAAIPARGQGEERFYYEFIRYEVLNRSKMSALEKYWEKAAIPAFNRLGTAGFFQCSGQVGEPGLGGFDGCFQFCQRALTTELLAFLRRPGTGLAGGWLPFVRRG